MKLSPNGTVLGGPFLGMTIPEDTVWLSPALYLSGAYEEELQPWILEAASRRPPVVVDVGAAEGYYAVGLARLLPAAIIHAFDIDPQAQKATRRTAHLNHASNVLVHGRVNHRLLQQVLVPGALVFSDCEGYEGELLDPVRVPSLRQATVIVELHDVFNEGVGAAVRDRFGDTHTVTRVPQAIGGHPHRPQLAHLTAEEQIAVTDEGRPGDPRLIEWAVMVPHFVK